MPETCGCPPEAGNVVCNLLAQTCQHPARVTSLCPVCEQSGKPVQTQTVKALLAVSLRQVREGE